MEMTEKDRVKWPHPIRATTRRRAKQYPGYESKEMIKMEHQEAIKVDADPEEEKEEKKKCHNQTQTRSR